MKKLGGGLTWQLMRFGQSSKVGWRGVKTVKIGVAILTFTSFLLSSCQPQPYQRALPTEQIKRRPLSQGSQSRKITFREANGRPQFSLQFKPTGGKLIDHSGKVIANLILESDGAIKLTDAGNQTVGYIVQSNDTWQVQSPKRAKPLFVFRREADGSATLARNDGSAVYELKTDNGGYQVESDKRDRYTVTTTKGIGQLQSETGQTVIATDSAILPVALASFGFDKLTEAQQAGLAYALSTESQ
jgi:hypothetical protein